jgi:hypothetical protein
MEEKYIVSQETVLMSLEGLFNKTLLSFDWTNSIDSNRKVLIDEFNKICKIFEESGLIYEFNNIVDLSDILSDISKGSIQDVSIMYTFIKFFENGTNHVITSIVKSSIDFKILELETLDPKLFIPEIKKLLENLSFSEKIKMLTEKQDVSRMMKMIHIKKQQYEPAAMWRDCERKLQSMLSETTEPYPIPPSRVIENKNDVE